MRLVLVGTLMATLACTDTGEERVAPPGEPVPGLDVAERERFAEGQLIFDRDFTVAEGLGPLFNQRRCSSCHDVPSLGGNGVEPVAKATRFTAGRCDLLERHGGDLVQRSATPALEALGIRGETVPAEANAVAAIMPPPLYGLGLIEAIDEAEILRRADPEDADGDGIRGRAVRLPDGRLGRFGRKLSFATLRGFIADALRGEIGITSPDLPEEVTFNGAPLPPEADPAADPEATDAVVTALTDYVRFLAAPERELPATAAAADSIARGELLFGRIGCGDCHTPRMRTGRSDVRALDRKTVALYSDLLLHDMGNDLASVCGAAAGPSEWRTAPLLGLRLRNSLLHDGRTQSYATAIALHGGEAARSRTAYDRLTPAQQADLLRFLASL